MLVGDLSGTAKPGDGSNPKIGPLFTANLNKRCHVPIENRLNDRYHGGPWILFHQPASTDINMPLLRTQPAGGGHIARGAVECILICCKTALDAGFNRGNDLVEAGFVIVNAVPVQ